MATGSGQGEASVGCGRFHTGGLQGPQFGRYRDALSGSSARDRSVGSFVLVYDDGAEQSYPTEWLDHRSTGKRMWYRYGVSSTFEASENRRVYRGSSYDLDPIKESLMKADEPTRTKAWVKVRPADDRAALKTQFHRMRRKGYTLEDASGPLHGFKTATTRQGGIEMRAAVGAVSTKAGLVMIFSEIPVAEPDPLPALIRDLQQ